ncbi:hypothetical protein [Nocardiopsis protaetiae]|uniref:hypothetical protein n=1 Tax=Nocardiopsis protaetiae TaxID=3382270 RepID=UPI00387B744B
MSGEESSTLADMRRVLEVGLTELRGRLDVIIERLEQQDKRADAHAAQISELDGRLDTVEKTAVTREDMDARARRTISIVAIVVTCIGIVVGALVTITLTLVT